MWTWEMNQKLKDVHAGIKTWWRNEIEKQRWEFYKDASGGFGVKLISNLFI